MNPEKSLIATCLQWPSTLPTIMSMVKPTDISGPVTRRIYRQLLDQYDKSKTCSINALTINELEQSALIDWCDATASAVGFEALAAVVVATGRRERIKKAIEDAEIALKDDVSIEEVLASIQKASIDSSASTAAKSLHDLAREAISQEEPTIYRSGLTTLDSLLRMSPKQLGIFAARPGQGKSSIARQIALFNGASKRVLVNSSEMADLEVSNAICGLFMRTSASRINKRGLTDGEKAKVLAVSEKIAVNISEHNTIPEVEKEIAIAKNAGNPYKIVIIDYLQLLEVAEKVSNRQEAVSSITRKLKKIAMKEDLLMIALSQFNRQATEAPALHHLRESGSIEQDANWVVAIDGVEGDEERKALIKLKDRNGGLGQREVRWRAEYTMMEDLG